MQLTNSSNRFKNNADSLLASAIGFCFILLLTSHGGIGISPDSVYYSSVAENMVNHGSAVDFKLQTLTDFPLFYPSLLAGVQSVTGMSPLLAGPVLNACLFALVVFSAGCTMERFVFRSRWYKCIILSVLVLSPCLLEIYSMLWSETVFVLLTILFIPVLCRYFRDYSLRFLILAAGIAAIAAVTRYAGITIAGTGGLLLLTIPGMAWRKKIGHLFIFGFISISLLAANIIHNNLQAGTFTGDREKGTTALPDNIKDASAVVFSWLPIPPGDHRSAGFIVIVMLLILLMTAWTRQRIVQRLSGCEQIILTFLIVYLVFMVVIATISRFQQLDNRLLSPLFIPLIWVGSYWLPPLMQKIPAPGKYAALALCGFLFMAFQDHQVKADAHTWEDVKDAGIPGYTEDGWRNSPTVQFVRQRKDLFKEGYTIYSDAPDAVYFFSGIKAEYLPHREFLGDVREFLEDSTSYVIWFNDGINPDLINLNYINTFKKPGAVLQFKDGVIYTFDGSQKPSQQESNGNNN